jgi:hypothetical protein
VIELLSDLIKWFVPPIGHDPVVEAIYRWRVAVFGCISFVVAVGGGVMMTLEWGSPIIRPASAQMVQRQVTAAKEDLSKQIQTVQQQIKAQSDTQHTDRLERLDQQLFWYRQQNCKVKNDDAKRLYYQKLKELEQRYRDLTGSEWAEPTCRDIGEPP